MRRKEIAVARKAYRDCELKRPQVQEPKNIKVEHEMWDSRKSQVKSTMTCPTVEDMGIPNPQSRAEARNDGKAIAKSLKNLEKVCGATMCATCIYKGASDLVEAGLIRARIADSLRAIAGQPGDSVFSLGTPSVELPQEPPQEQ